MRCVWSGVRCRALLARRQASAIRLHQPILNFEPFDSAEIFDVVGNDDGLDASHVRGDHQVVGPDELPLLF